MRADHYRSGPGFPPEGRAFGGNDVHPIRWSLWLTAAPVAGVAAGTAGWLTTGGSLFVAALLVAAIGSAFLTLPLRIRNYRRPQPPPVHVGYDGLSVHLAEKSWWRPGSYHRLHWSVVSELTSLPPATPGGIEAPLRITVTPPGRAAACDVPGPVGESLRSTGTVVLADAVRPDLARAVAHYSAHRCQLAFESRRTPI